MKGNLIFYDVYGNGIEFQYTGKITPDEKELIEGLQKGKFTLLQILPAADANYTRKLRAVALYSVKYEPRPLIHDHPNAAIVFVREKMSPAEKIKFKQRITEFYK